MSGINFMLNWVEHEKYILGTCIRRLQQGNTNISVQLHRLAEIIEAIVHFRERLCFSHRITTGYTC